MSKVKIHCDCHNVQIQLENFPKSCAGRIVCYCDDCQKYLRKIDREELLDSYGGSEIIPIHPGCFNITQGQENLICYSLSPRGLRRWTAKCCNTPIVNTTSSLPWMGLSNAVFENSRLNREKELGEIKVRVMGKFMHGKPPFKVSQKVKFLDLFKLSSYLIKGLLFKDLRRNPLFQEDGSTTIFPVVLLKKD